MTGYVYLVEAVGTGLFKIGKANDVRNRIRSLQTACPYRLRLVNCCHCPEPMLLENELHRLFDEHRKVGEWFALPYAAVKECVTLLSVSNEPVPEPIATETVEALEAAFDLDDIPDLAPQSDITLRLSDIPEATLTAIKLALEFGKSRSWIIENILKLKGRRFNEGKGLLIEILKQIEEQA